MAVVGVIVDNQFDADVRVRKEVGILTRHGHEVHVLCYGEQNSDTIDGAFIHRINLQKGIINLLFFFLNRVPLFELLWGIAIARLIRAKKVDVLHVHDLYMSRAGYWGMVWSRKKIPIILDLHENYPAAVQTYNWTKGTLRQLLSYPKAWEKKEGAYLRYASHLIVLSSYFKRSLLSRFPFLTPGRIRILPNVIDFHFFEQLPVEQTERDPEEVVLFYFGAIAERRGIFETIEVFRRLLQERPHVCLLLIGPVDRADKSRFFDLIHSDTLSSAIRYIPWIDLAELPSYLNRIDICLSPLHKNPQHESGVANKIFQYMFGKRPIVVSNCIPQQELINQGACGLVYDSLESYLSCLKTLVDDPQKRKRMGENGYHYLYKNYNNGHVEETLLGLYQELEGGGKA